MRVLVCGGRHYARRDLIYLQLDRLHARLPICALVHGAATGADTLAADWAEERGVETDPYPIMPGEGGFARNGRMLAEGRPELVVHFPGGNGTADMVERARQAGVSLLGGLEPLEECQQSLFQTLG